MKFEKNILRPLKVLKKTLVNSPGETKFKDSRQHMLISSCTF